MIDYANRGSAFESIIEFTNKQYFDREIAIIQKVPTPWKVSFDPRSGYSKAFPEKKSTVDFIGQTNGLPVCFEAKSTRETTRFPLSNISEHQVTFMKKWYEQKGLSFLLIDFPVQNEVYLLSIPKLEQWIYQAETGGRKSIPYEWIEENCKTVRSHNGLGLDYLSAVLSSPQEFMNLKVKIN